MDYRHVQYLSSSLILYLIFSIIVIAENNTKIQLLHASKSDNDVKTNDDLKPNDDVKTAAVNGAEVAHDNVTSQTLSHEELRRHNGESTVGSHDRDIVFNSSSSSHTVTSTTPSSENYVIEPLRKSGTDNINRSLILTTDLVGLTNSDQVVPTRSEESDSGRVAAAGGVEGSATGEGEQGGSERKKRHGYEQEEKAGEEDVDAEDEEYVNVPKFMVDLYNRFSVERYAHPTANVVRSFQTINQQGCDGQSFPEFNASTPLANISSAANQSQEDIDKSLRSTEVNFRSEPTFTFNVTSVGQEEDIYLAELRLYRLPQTTFSSDDVTTLQRYKVTVVELVRRKESGTVTRGSAKERGECGGNGGEAAANEEEDVEEVIVCVREVESGRDDNAVEREVSRGGGGVGAEREGKRGGAVGGSWETFTLTDTVSRWVRRQNFNTVHVLRLRIESVPLEESDRDPPLVDDVVNNLPHQSYHQLQHNNIVDESSSDKKSFRPGARHGVNAESQESAKTGSSDHHDVAKDSSPELKFETRRRNVNEPLLLVFSNDNRRRRLTSRDVTDVMHHEFDAEIDGDETSAEWEGEREVDGEEPVDMEKGNDEEEDHVEASVGSSDFVKKIVKRSADIQDGEEGGKVEAAGIYEVGEQGAGGGVSTRMRSGGQSINRTPTSSAIGDIVMFDQRGGGAVINLTHIAPHSERLGASTTVRRKEGGGGGKEGGGGGAGGRRGTGGMLEEDRKLPDVGAVKFRRSAKHQRTPPEGGGAGGGVAGGKGSGRGRGKNSCRRKPMYINFEDINWQNWIISPKGYQAYECVGRCSFPLSEHLTPTKHAIIQTMLHAHHPNKASPTCCVPTRLDPISILYIDNKQTVTYKYKYEGMVVAECGCR